MVNASFINRHSRAVDLIEKRNQQNRPLKADSAGPYMWAPSGRTLLYLHLPDGAAETKFSGKGLDKILGVAATGRNWNTVLKLFAMSKDRG